MENQSSSYAKVSDGLWLQLSLSGFARKVDQCINCGIKAPVSGVAAVSLALSFTFVLMVYKTEQKMQHMLFTVNSKSILP